MDQNYDKYFEEILEELKNNNKCIEKLSEQINDLQEIISNFIDNAENETHLEVTVNRNKKIESWW